MLFEISPRFQENDFALLIRQVAEEFKQSGYSPLNIDLSGHKIQVEHCFGASFQSLSLQAVIRLIAKLGSVKK